MFAVPPYLADWRGVLLGLGAREVLELEVTPEAPQLQPAERAAWLYEHGASCSDCTVVTRGGSLPLHRPVLMASCEYFRTMLGSGFREGSEENVRVDLLDVSFDAATIVFRYLYTGSVPDQLLYTTTDDEREARADIAAEVLEVADRFRIDYLFEYAQVWIANEQTLDQGADVLAFARLHGAHTLERATLGLLAAHWDAPEVQRLLPSLDAATREELHARAARDSRAPR